MSQYLTLATYVAILLCTIGAAYLKVLPVEYVPAIFTGLIGILIPSPIKPVTPTIPTPIDQMNTVSIPSMPKAIR